MPVGGRTIFWLIYETDSQNEPSFENFKDYNITYIMIKEAIILAGGLGTRLREAVPDLPKCMAPILAKPFIGYLVDYLHQQGIQNFIFSWVINQTLLNNTCKHNMVIYTLLSV